MSWGEAVRLVRVLKDDPTSPLHATLAEWTHTATRTELILTQLVDLFARVHFERGDELRPRLPWEAPPAQPTAMPREQLAQILLEQRQRAPQQRQGRVQTADS